MYYTFDVEIATYYKSSDLAILIGNFDYWLHKNLSNSRNLFKGRVWTYNTAEAFAEQFPYLSTHQIRRLLKKMEDLNILRVGNFNRLGFDQTKWYTFTDEFAELHKSNLRICKTHLAKSQNGVNKIVTPIPYYKLQIKNQKKKIEEKPLGQVAETSSNYYKNEESELKQAFNTVLRYCKKHTEKSDYRLTLETTHSFNELLDTYTVEDFKKALKNFEYTKVGKENPNRLTPLWFTNPKVFEYNLNFREKPTKKREKTEKEDIPDHLVMARIPKSKRQYLFAGSTELKYITELSEAEREEYLNELPKDEREKLYKRYIDEISDR